MVRDRARERRGRYRRGHFRIKDSGGTTTHIQGTFGENADTPDMVADNKNIATGQTVTITQFDYTRGNA